MHFPVLKTAHLLLSDLKRNHKIGIVISQIKSIDNLIMMLKSIIIKTLQKNHNLICDIVFEPQFIKLENVFLKKYY